MKKDTDRNRKSRKKAENGGKTVKNKASGKSKRPVTEIWDFNLDDELEAQNMSKDAAEAYGGEMPEKPVSLDTGTLELLEVEELVGKATLKEAAEEASAAQKKRAAEEAPAEQKKQAAEEEPAAHRKQAAEEAPAAHRKQAAEEEPAAHRKQAAEEAPAAHRKQAAEEEPAAHRKQAAEEEPAAHRKQAAEEAPVPRKKHPASETETGKKRAASQENRREEGKGPSHAKEKKKAAGAAGAAALSEKKRPESKKAENKKPETSRSENRRSENKKSENKKSEKRRDAEQSAAAVRRAGKSDSGKKKKKRAAWLEDFGAMDVIVALTGVIVLAVAVFTIRIYTNANTVSEQVDAMAEVGEKMEAIGIAGDSVFMAVADARLAAQEAAELDPEAGLPDGSEQYVEKELQTQVRLGLKLTSIQRDLKIKFTNKESGKLIGNQAFEVRIDGPESMTKTDDDKDGIIYISSIKPGEYTVTVTAPAEIDGNSAAGVSGMVTVKDQIEYKKVDVTDEVKSEAEVNVAKEDTQVKMAVESVLTDTVEWVESSQTPLNGAQITYEEVKKSDIPEPSTVAFLGSVLAPQTETAAYFSQEAQERVRKEAQPWTVPMRISAGGVYFTEMTSEQGSTESSAPESTESSEPGSTDPSESGSTEPSESESSEPSESESTGPSEPESSAPAVEVVSVTVTADSARALVGQTVSLSAKVDKKNDNGEACKISWSCSGVGKLSGTEGETVTLTSDTAGTASVTATASIGDSSKSSEPVKVEFYEEKPAESGVKIEIEDPGSVRVGEEKQLNKKIEGSYDPDSVAWESMNKDIATFTDPKNGKVKGLTVSRVKITLSVTGKDGKVYSAESELNVVSADAAIVLDPAALSMKAKEKKTVKASVTTTGDKAVEWKIGDETIVKLSETKDDSCVVEALKPGRTTLTAVSKANPDKTASCEITVELSDGTALLKDKNGKQLYYKDGDTYREATAADYYKYDVFYRQKDASQYLYTGWQTLDGKRYYFDKNGVPVTGSQIIQGMQYNFNSDGSLQVNGAMGIDISRHNGDIDWNAVKNAGVNFVILRCGYRGSSTGVLLEDQKFRSNIQGAAAAGLKVGVYFFSQAVNEVEAVEEASLTLDLIRRYGISYPVFMDVEDANGRADRIDAGTRTKIIRAFCETIRSGGYSAGVYANKTWLNEKMNVGQLSGYKIWLAQYASKPTYGGRYDMWQYSCKGRLPGISTDVDLNMSYMSY